MKIWTLLLAERATVILKKEIEQFREILYTMNQKEVADWNRSLTIRGINIPNDLKDEMIMMIENN